MGYHDKRTIREWIARPLYHIPELTPKFERFLILQIIMRIEGKRPRWKHLGKKCPCMTEKDIVGEM